MLHIKTHRVNMRGCPVLSQSQPSAHNQMLKLPPPIWALINVLTAAVISWFFGWSKVPGPPTRTPGNLVSRDFVGVLPVWAIVLFRREGHRGRTHFTNQSEAYYKRSLSVYPQSNVPRPSYSYSWHCNLGRRVADVWCPLSPVRYCQLGSHSL